MSGENLQAGNSVEYVSETEKYIIPLIYSTNKYMYNVSLVFGFKFFFPLDSTERIALMS